MSKKTVRHILAMRFQSENFGHSVNDAGAAEKWSRLAKTSTNSILNLRGFDPDRTECVYVIGDELDTRLVAGLCDDAVRLGARFIRKSAFPAHCESVRRSSDITVITRCDLDDMLANWILEDTLSAAARMSPPFSYGYDKGLLYRSGTSVLRSFDRTYSDGHMSAFQSLVVSRDDDRMSMLNPFGWFHNNVSKALRGRGFDDPRKMIVKGDGHGPLPAFVYVRHADTWTGDGPDKDAAYKEVSVDADDFRRTYGNDRPF